MSVNAYLLDRNQAYASQINNFISNEGLRPSDTKLPWVYTYLLPNKAIGKAEDTTLVLKEKGTSCGHYMANI